MSVLEVEELAGGDVGKLLDVVRCPVGQRLGLQVGPEVLDRVELGGVGRQIFDREVPAAPDDLLNSARPVDVEVVPDEDQAWPEMASEVAEEGDDPFGMDVLVGRRENSRRTLRRCGPASE